jgi:hypothetical protein
MIVYLHGLSPMFVFGFWVTAALAVMWHAGVVWRRSQPFQAIAPEDSNLSISLAE